MGEILLMKKLLLLLLFIAGSSFTLARRPTLLEHLQNPFNIFAIFAGIEVTGLGLYHGYQQFNNSNFLAQTIKENPIISINKSLLAISALGYLYYAIKSELTDRKMDRLVEQQKAEAIQSGNENRPPEAIGVQIDELNIIENNNFKYSTIFGLSTLFFSATTGLTFAMNKLIEITTQSK